jgi:hypothetical protein
MKAARFSQRAVQLKSPVCALLQGLLNFMASLFSSRSSSCSIYKYSTLEVLTPDRCYTECYGVEPTKELPMITIKLGDTSTTVTECQKLLSNKGFHVTCDGHFGPQTHAAVIQFQASESLTLDGVVGPLTWSRLLSIPLKTPATLLQEEKHKLTEMIPSSPEPARRALLYAISALGAREEPDGSNHSPLLDPFVEGYREYWQIDSPHYPPYCAIFVSSCIARAYGLSAEPSWGDWLHHPFYDAKLKGGAWLGSAIARKHSLESWAKKNDRWLSSRAVPSWPPGAFFTMGRGRSSSDPSRSSSAGHTGFVLRDNGATITTVEANVNNSVLSRERKKKDLRGWAAWW